MRIHTAPRPNDFKSRIVNELPSVGRSKIGHARHARLRDGGRFEALQTLYPDSDVAMRVLRALNDRHFSTLKELEVSVQRSEATITGQVNSFYEKQIAISLCHAVPGMLRLIDRITVREYLDKRD